MRVLSFFSSFSLVWALASCGAPAAIQGGSPSSACDVARSEAAAAWASVADHAHAAARAGAAGPTSAAERALERLEDHAAALEAQPREVDGNEAFGLSSALMDAIDATEVPPALRNRADDAAEALLTLRGERDSARAARDAVAVLKEVVRTTRPGALEQRERRRALSSLEDRARSAAESYRHLDPQQADVRADRAEGAPVPEDAPGAVVQARARAVEASTAVRTHCRFDRSLSVPSP